MDIEKPHEKLGCPLLILLGLLMIIPLSTGYIDCRISCRRCHENTEHPSVLEVYCAMCEECKQRRRERMRDGVADSAEALAKSLVVTGAQSAAQQAEQGPQQPGQSVQPQQGQQLPTQQPQHPSRPAQRGAYGGEIERIYPSGCPTPPLCSDSEETELLVFPTTSTTTTTTQPTTPPCPPVHACRKKKKMMPCMPCMPMCPCPMYTYPQGPVVLMQTTTNPTTHVDYHYVYIGLPKNALRSS